MAHARRHRSRGLGSAARERTLLFLEAHLCEVVRLDEIAAAACVSRAHFSRQFRVTFGTTPLAYLQSMKIERAKDMLRESDLPLSVLALSLGFCDQSHFSRVFRRNTGMTPSSFARSLRPDTAARSPRGT